ncbi:MAG: hypothetical protein B6D62_01885 [Candidatus Cloacimonas sp. 4484_275]|nr:MAG: hypothetical protein B6D62_01885 [Candidatus Cloacimonas sp. 4484_275]
MKEETAKTDAKNKSPLNSTEEEAETGEVESTEDNRTKIDFYKFGKISINGKVFTKDLIIFPDGIIFPWIRKTGHLLVADDISEYLDNRIKTLIIGTGYYGFMRIDESLKIDFVYRKTQEAVTFYNDLENKENIAFGMHLTC